MVQICRRYQVHNFINVVYKLTELSALEYDKMSEMSCFFIEFMIFEVIL